MRYTYTMALVLGLVAFTHNSIAAENPDFPDYREPVECSSPEQFGAFYSKLKSASFEPESKAINFLFILRNFKCSNGFWEERETTNEDILNLVNWNRYWFDLPDYQGESERPSERVLGSYVSIEVPMDEDLMSRRKFRRLEKGEEVEVVLHVYYHNHGWGDPEYSYDANGDGLVNGVSSIPLRFKLKMDPDNGEIIVNFADPVEGFFAN